MNKQLCIKEVERKTRKPKNEICYSDELCALMKEQEEMDVDNAIATIKRMAEEKKK